MYKNSLLSKIIFILSLLEAIYWLLGKSINIYGSELVGAIYEILWLPALIGLVAIPLISAIFLIREKYSVKSLYQYSLLIVTGTILYMTMF